MLMEDGLLREFNLIMKKENENIAIIFGLGLIGQIALEALTQLNFRIIGVDISEDNGIFDKYSNLVEYKLCDATKEDEVMGTLNQIFSDHKSPNLLINALGLDSKVGTHEEGFENLSNQESTGAVKETGRGMGDTFNPFKDRVDASDQIENRPSFFSPGGGAFDKRNNVELDINADVIISNWHQASFSGSKMTSAGKAN